MKKSLLLLFMFLVAGAGSLFSQEAYYMVCHKSGNSIVRYLVEDIDSIAFEQADKVIFLSDGTTVRYAVADMDSVTFEQDETITSGQAVDLGLSVKWAGWNVGASSPESYGSYYAWGETEEKSNYSWDTYKYYNVNSGIIYDIGNNITGTEYDVAHVKWGTGWRMPTHVEQQELCQKCTWTWTSYNGVNGMKVTGPNGNSIFLPAAGYRSGTDVFNRGYYGYYWSGSLYYEGMIDYDYAWSLGFGSLGLSSWGDVSRFFGHSVRPVSDP